MGSTGRIALLLGALLVVAWGAKDHLVWPAKLPQLQQLQQLPQLPTEAPKSAGALRKCLPESGAGAVLYSSSACPPGTREQAISGGTVNVVPSVAAVAPAKSASAQPLLHRLAPPEEAAALREKMMERAVNP